MTVCDSTFNRGQFACYLQDGHKGHHTDGLGMVWLSDEEIPACRFQPGQRVVRQYDPFDKKSQIMHGTIMYAYGEQIPESETRSKTWTYPELYAVRWDHYPYDVQKGYMSHGLDPER